MGAGPEIDFYKNQYVQNIGLGVAKSQVPPQIHDNEAVPVRPRKSAVPMYDMEDQLEPADQEMDLEPGPGHLGMFGQ